MKKLLYTAVFFAGMTSLAVEFCASRLLGNYFGTSNLVWASIIGLILIYLTLGYFIGGAWADRSPKFKTFFTILVWSGFSVGLIPLISRPILRFSAQAFDNYQFGVLIGSFVAVMILFSIPVTLLGTASPFAIRLGIKDASEAGGLSGRIYATSTLGAFIGTFLPVLVLIPTIGTYRTFLVFSLLLVGISLFGMWKAVGKRSAVIYLWMPAILILLLILGVRGFDKNSPGLIYETESAYNYIQVQEKGGYRFLRLNEGQGTHSTWHPTELFYGGPWEQVLAGPFFNSPGVDLNGIKEMAIVGLAAGTTARQAASVFPNIHIDGYEIDPKIIDVGRQYFGMDIPQLTSIAEDGRMGLAESEKRYQLISVDAYRPPYIPAHLTTEEYFQTVFDHLTPDGVMVINVGRAPEDRRLVDALFSTISQVFPSVYIADLPLSFNTLIYATKSPTSVSNLAANIDLLEQRGNPPPLLMKALYIAFKNIQPSPKVDDKLVFTDDRSPVEWITNSMIVKYIVYGQMEQLQ
jgi:predicted membrane-bound spermidine synthase